MAKVEPTEKTQTSDILPVVYRPTWLLKVVDSPRLAEPQTTSLINYTYDPLGRLSYADYGEGNFFQYSYDAVGNRLSETTALGTTTYTYTNNKLSSITTSAGTVNLIWDNNGNLLDDGTSIYSYNHANRLTSVTTGGTNYTFTYNGLGDRVSQTVNGVTTHYTLDLNAGLTQVLADGPNIYLYGKERIAQYTGNAPAYFLGDALNSVRQLIDASGVVTLAKTYKPFGDTLSSTGSGTSVFAFDGEQTDATGLQYLRARYYSMQYWKIY